MKHVKRLKHVKQLKHVKHLAEAAAGSSKARERSPRCRIIAPEAFDLIAAAHNTFAPDAYNIVSNAYIRIGFDTHFRAVALAGPPPPTPKPQPVSGILHQNNRSTNTTHRSREISTRPPIHDPNPAPPPRDAESLTSPNGQ